MGLTQKILLFVSLLVMALVGTTLAFTTFQANRLAHATIYQALSETRGVWETFQTDRYNKLKLGDVIVVDDASPDDSAAVGAALAVGAVDGAALGKGEVTGIVVVVWTIGTVRPSAATPPVMAGTPAVLW